MTRRNLLGLLMLVGAGALAWLWRRRDDGPGEGWVATRTGYVYDSFEHKLTAFSPHTPVVWAALKDAMRRLPPPSQPFRP